MRPINSLCPICKSSSDTAVSPPKRMVALSSCNNVDILIEVIQIAAFPLTPALSLGAMENCFQPHKPKRDRISNGGVKKITKRQSLLPLPAGEGQGAGNVRGNFHFAELTWPNFFKLSRPCGLVSISTINKSE